MSVQKITDSEEAKLKELGARIRARRKALGYPSVDEFANAKKLNRVQYWRYEVGENMKLVNLDRVAFALEMPLDELIKGIFGKVN